MSQTRKIDRERWSEFLSMFSNGNRRRIVAIEVADPAGGDQPLTDAAPLFAIDYDPAGKGDDLVVTAGRDEVDYTHTISARRKSGNLRTTTEKYRPLRVSTKTGGIILRIRNIEF